MAANQTNENPKLEWLDEKENGKNGLEDACFKRPLADSRSEEEVSGVEALAPARTDWLTTTRKQKQVKN